MDLDPNHALLVGQVFGALAAVPDESWTTPTLIELERDSAFTGRIIIHRPSGRWALSLELIEAAGEAA